MLDFQNNVKLINNLSYKYTKTFTYNSNKVEGVLKFGESLNLNRDFIYTLKLDGFYGWENIINITNENNKLNYTPGVNSNAKTITIPEGIWNFNDINKKIKSILLINGDVEDNITLSPDVNEYKMNIILKGGYRVDFNIDNSINKVLGFEKKSYSYDGTHKSENNPNISSTQVFFVVIDLIQPNNLQKQNGELKHLQYVRAIKPFQKHVGEAVIVEDSNPNKYRLLENVYNYTKCNISLVDEDGKLIKTKGDEFTIVFTIESA